MNALTLSHVKMFHVFRNLKLFNSVHIVKKALNAKIQFKIDASLYLRIKHLHRENLKR